MARRTIGLFMALAGAGLLGACAGPDDDTDDDTGDDTAPEPSTDAGLSGPGEPWDPRSGRSCSFARTKGTYGFHCSGSQDLGEGLVPVAGVGVVKGDGRGGFTARATASSPMGSLRQRLSGSATLDADCFGRVTYDVNQFEMPPGSDTWVDFPPLILDFAMVDGGREILAAQVAPDGTGDAVPRLTCRVVKTRGHD